MCINDCNDWKYPKTDQPIRKYSIIDIAKEFLNGKVSSKIPTAVKAHTKINNAKPPLPLKVINVNGVYDPAISIKIAQ